MVGIGNTSTNKPSDAAIIRLKGQEKGLAVTVDCNSKYVHADAYKGGLIAVSEAARNIVCSGAKPVAITNCLNFGNPYDPEVYWNFVEALKGMGDACLKFETPVTGGNVSFYNQSPTRAVNPTPTIGMLGIIENTNNAMTLDFKEKGNLIYLLGKSRADIACSEYLDLVHQVALSPAPYFDLEEEFKLQNTILELIKNKLVESVHDISEGGLFVTLTESALPNQLGFEINTDKSIRKDAYLFGESQSRAVVSIKLENKALFEKELNIPFEFLGEVVENEILIDGENFGIINDFKNKYDNAIEEVLLG
jgi:phosphoribosylformylglycinamidine synthase